MSYAPPVDLDTFYDEDTLDYLFRIMHGHQWAIHLIGPDEIHYNEDFEKPEDDPTNPELTQRTALKTAAELNAFVASQVRPDENPPLMYHAVVFHQGEPWVPAESDGSADEYCEWFDHDSYDWFCNQCFRVLKESAAHCPTCAPTRIPGLRRLPCDADPAHPALFMYADNQDGYCTPTCFYCIGEHQREVDLERRHAGHRAWRTWKTTRWVLRGLYRLGMCKGWCYSLCHRQGRTCMSGFVWRWSR